MDVAGDAPPPPGLRLPRRIGEAPHGVPGPSRGVDGRWTVDAWAPLDGRVLNGGVLVTF